MLRTHSVCALVLFVCVGSLFWSNEARAVDEAPKVVEVDCDTGKKTDTITDALTKHPGKALEIRFQGSCHEGVVLHRDNVTIIGVEPGATIIGPTDEIRVDALTVVDSRNVLLKDFALFSDLSYALQIRQSGPVYLDGLVGYDSRTGCSIDRSLVEIRDCEFYDNDNFGLSIWWNSTVAFGGSFLNVHDNSVGLVVSESTVDVERDGRQANHTVSAVDNRRGVSVQKQAEVKLFNLYATGNTQAGARVRSGAHLWISRNTDVVGNPGNGVDVADQAAVSIVGRIADNDGIGLRVSGQAQGTISWSEVSGNGYGLVVEGGGQTTIYYSTIGGSENGPELDLHGGTAYVEGLTTDGNGDVDVALEFGSRATFSGSNQVTTVVCDGTALVEGDVTCSTTLSRRQSTQHARPTLARPGVLEMEDGR